MSQNTENQEKLSPPYKGLEPYSNSKEDAEIFFGRKEWRDTIIEKLMATRLTLLYGVSGVGKTSVLQAGVAHDLDRLTDENLKNHREPGHIVFVFNSWSGDLLVDLIQQMRDKINKSTL